MNWSNWQEVRTAYPLSATITAPAPNLDLKPGDSFAFARKLPTGVEVLLWADARVLVPKHCCTTRPPAEPPSAPACQADGPHAKNRNAWEWALSQSPFGSEHTTESSS